MGLPFHSKPGIIVDRKMNHKKGLWMKELSQWRFFYELFHA